jgi:hypothetical protein
MQCEVQQVDSSNRIPAQCFVPEIAMFGAI